MINTSKIEVDGMDLDYMLMIYNEYTELVEEFTGMRGVFLAEIWKELNETMDLLRKVPQERYLTYSKAIYENPAFMEVLLARVTERMYAKLADE